MENLSSVPLNILSLISFQSHLASGIQVTYFVLLPRETDVFTLLRTQRGFSKLTSIFMAPVSYPLCDYLLWRLMNDGANFSS